MSSELFEEKLAREWTDRDARAMLREQGFDAELGARQKTLRGVTPLHATARAGHLDQLKWLVDKGADVKALDVLHNSPLHECCRGGDYASLEFIIEVIFAAGGGVDDLRKVNLNNLKPHELAQRNAHAACAQLCFDRGAENLGLRAFSEKWVASQPPLKFFDDDVPS